MPGQFIDAGAPSLQGNRSNNPQSLPHGLIAPPPQVREMVERERVKYVNGTFAQAEERLLNEWTIAYFFDYLNHEVLYRATADGPEVLAVGTEEVLTFKKNLPLAEQLKLQTFLGY